MPQRSFCDRQSFFNGNRSLSDAVGESWSIDVFEDECSHAVRLFKAVDTADVGMVELGEDFGFAFKPGQPVGIVCEGLWQDFEGYVPVELRVSCPIHLAHAAFADLGGDGVRAEGGAGGKRHGQFAGTRSFNSSNQFTAST